MIRTRDGKEPAVKNRSRLSVMSIIRDNGFDELLALCGGSCATCHVSGDPQFWPKLPTMSEGEDDLLDGFGRHDANARLNRQIPFSDPLDGLCVTIAPEA